MKDIIHESSAYYKMVKILSSTQNKIKLSENEDDCLNCMQSFTSAELYNLHAPLKHTETIFQIMAMILTGLYQ